MFKAIFILLTLFMYAQASIANDRLVAFQTDYCTGIPEGTPTNPTAWKNCCLMHDMLFWSGGDKNDRDEADLGLRKCVADKGYPNLSWIIYEAVRLGSYSPIKFENKKWNFGWPDRPEHQKLTSQDIDQVEKEIFKPEYSYIPLHIKVAFIYDLRTRR
ncbi:MAG: hypothetical protein ACJ76H_16545 [Bacteriovoracaceae bacterium]